MLSALLKKIKPGMGEEIAADAINSMAGFMKRQYGKDVIILLDEYDTPMQEAWLHGCMAVGGKQ